MISGMHNDFSYFEHDGLYYRVDAPGSYHYRWIFAYLGDQGPILYSKDAQNKFSIYVNL